MESFERMPFEDPGFGCSSCSCSSWSIIGKGTNSKGASEAPKLTATFAGLGDENKEPIMLFEPSLEMWGKE